MNDEEQLIVNGADAVVRALTGCNVEDLNIDVLAQVCARKARAASDSRNDALAWALAAIACYRKTAESRTRGYDRQGSEVPLFGLRALMILRWGAEPNHAVLDADDILQWIHEEMDVFISPTALREALDRAGSGDFDHERAVCLKERLQLVLPLFEAGLFPGSLLPWFEVAKTKP